MIYHVKARLFLRTVIHRRHGGEQFKVLLVAQPGEHFHDLSRPDKNVRLPTKLLHLRLELFLQCLNDLFEFVIHALSP